MAFDGTEGGAITLAAGADLTAEYRREYPNDRKGHFFGKDILNEILDQERCEGIRMYYGIATNGDKELVTVGADADDMTENEKSHLMKKAAFVVPLGNKYCPQDIVLPDINV